MHPPKVESLQSLFVLHFSNDAGLVVCALAMSVVPAHWKGASRLEVVVITAGGFADVEILLIIVNFET